MDKNLEFVNEQKILRTIKALEKNNMCGYYLKSRNELFEVLKTLLPDNSVVSCGGSVTLFETGIIEYLRQGNFEFLDRYAPNLTDDDIKQVFRQSFFADIYFTSTNAITEEGFLYNVDRTGNRVAAMLYGPDKVIVICGVNKIVKSVEEAIERNKQIAAPANAKRLDTKTPCKVTGECIDCQSPGRICGEYTLIKRQREANRIHVLFLNEVLGY